MPQHRPQTDTNHDKPIEADDVLLGWALGPTAAEHTMSDRERLLTAAMYAQIPGVVAHVRQTGRLPAMTPIGGLEIGLRLLVERRGLDIDLSDDERLVHSAMKLSPDVPVGCVVLMRRRRSQGRA